MKNKLLLIIDSFGNEGLGEIIPVFMPFLNEIMKKSVVYENMYSEAPYTEAALMSLYSGRNTMDNGGYLLNFKNTETVVDILNARGYRVYKNILPHIFPSSLYRGCTDYFYGESFDMNTLWSYRLEYYSKLYLENKLIDFDYVVLTHLMDDNFVELNNIYKKILERNDKIEFFYKNSEISYEQIQLDSDLVKDEYIKYQKNKIEYINNLLRFGKNHNLFKIHNIDQNKKCKNEVRKKNFYKEHYAVFKRIRQLNMHHNKLFDIELLNIILKKNSKIYQSKKMLFKFLFFNVLERKFDLDLKKRFLSNYDSFKNAPSMLSHCNRFIDWQKDISDPYFAIIHVDDIHNPEMFFSYDTDDENILSEEFDVIEKALSKIPSGYKGSISYLLSLSYVDFRLEKFFKQLEENGVLDNLEIYITGDHGFSFSYRHIREEFVTSFYLENYKVPFIIYNKYPTACINENLVSSRNIKKLILDDEYIECKDEVIFIEYMGAGCPDYIRRPVQLAAFNEGFMIVTEADYNKSFKNISVKEVYNLEEDPTQKNNLSKKIDIPAYNALFKKIVFRYEVLYRELNDLQI